MTLTLKNKKDPKTVGLVLDSYTHTRPTVTVKMRDKTLLVNLSGVRLTDIGDPTLTKKVEELCKGIGRVVSVSSCTRDLYENKPTAKEQGYFNSRPLIEWTTDNNVWYTFK